MLILVIKNDFLLGRGAFTKNEHRLELILYKSQFKENIKFCANQISENPTLQNAVKIFDDTLCNICGIAGSKLNTYTDTMKTIYKDYI